MPLAFHKYICTYVRLYIFRNGHWHMFEKCVIIVVIVPCERIKLRSRWPFWRHPLVSTHSSETPLRFKFISNKIFLSVRMIRKFGKMRTEAFNKTLYLRFLHFLLLREYTLRKWEYQVTKHVSIFFLINSDDSAFWKMAEEEIKVGELLMFVRNKLLTSVVNTHRTLHNYVVGN